MGLQLKWFECKKKKQIGFLSLQPHSKSKALTSFFARHSSSPSLLRPLQLQAEESSAGLGGDLPLGSLEDVCVHTAHWLQFS